MPKGQQNLLSDFSSLPSRKIVERSGLLIFILLK